MHFCSFFPRPTSFLDVPGNSRGSLLAEHTKYHQCPIPKDVCDKKQAFNDSQYLAGESSFAKAALKLNNTGFSLRASGQRNSLAISGELTAYFSLEITPVYY